MGALSLRGVSRRVAGAMGLFSGTQVFGILCSVIRTKIVAVWVGQAGIGLLAILSVAVEFLSSVGQMALRTTSVRLVSLADGKSDILEKCRLISHTAGRCAVGAVIGCMLLSPLLSLVTFGDYSRTATFAVLSVVLFLNTLVAARQGMLQGLGRLRDLAGGSVMAAVFSLIVTVPLIYFLRINGIVPVILTCSVVTAAMFILPRAMSIPMLPAGCISRSGYSAAGRRLLRFGLWLTVAGSITWLCEYIFMAWLRGHDGEEMVGLYQAGHTLTVKYVGIVFTAMAMEYYPRVTSASANPVRMSVFASHELGLVLKIATPVAILFMLTVPWVVTVLYSSDFLPVTGFVRMAVPATMLRAASWCLGFVILARGEGAVFALTESISAVTSLLLNVICYCHWGLTGLGASYLATYAVYTPLVALTVGCRYRVALRPKALILLAISLLLTLPLSICFIS